jgi:importin subunit beta-1
MFCSTRSRDMIHSLSV